MARACSTARGDVAPKGRKVTLFLNPHSSEILTRLSTERCISQTDVLNSAIAFYDERGKYIETLVKKSIREALVEVIPLLSKQLQEAGLCTR